MLYVGRRVLTDDVMGPRFKFLYRVVNKEQKRFFVNSNPASQHFRKMLLQFLEYTNVMVQSTQALHAARMASKGGGDYDSADEHFNEDRSALVQANQISAVAAPAVALNDTLNEIGDVNVRPRDKNKAKKKTLGTTTPLDSTEDEAPASNEEALASQKKRPESTRKRTRGYTEEQQKVFNYL